VDSSVAIAGTVRAAYNTVGAFVGFAVTGAGVGARVVGAGVGARVVGRGVGARVVGAGVGARVVGAGVGGGAKALSALSSHTIVCLSHDDISIGLVLTQPKKKIITKDGREE